MLRLDSTHLAEFFFAGGALTAWTDNGSGTEVNLTPNWPRYDAAAMQWVRFRETGGQLYFEYASTPGTWTTLASVADPFPMTAVKLRLIAGANTVATDVAKFDDVSTQ
jgi:hypothetical protein